MILSTATRQLARQSARRLGRSSTRRAWQSTAAAYSQQAARSTTLVAGAALLAAAAATTTCVTHNSAADALNIGPVTKESQTGIPFPSLCNGMQLVGVGVRIKYVFVKVYAVGTYMDPIAMMAVKRDPSKIQQALLDPTYPRTIRIVMNRGLSIEKYMAGIVESIEPRLQGQELEKLEEFKALNPPVDLVEGAEIEMTIRGDTLLYKNAVGGVGSLKSRLFCEALCDVYYGSDPVSPSLKDSTMEGIPKL